LIYFVQSLNGGPIKIGFTVNLLTRLKNIQIYCGSTVVPVAFVDGDRSLERAIHRRFAHARSRGEWFNPTPDLIDFMRNLADHLVPGMVEVGPEYTAECERLGFIKHKLRLGEIAALIRGKNGKPWARQRLTGIINSVRVEQATIDAIAKGLGVKPSELTRED
jgi:hypothetical protein